MAPRRPPPSDELVEKILLRLPTDDPASLLRAALACKRWARLVSGPGFRARFRDFHPAAAPPMLGFLCDHRGEDEDDDDDDGYDGGYRGDSVVSRFVRTSSFRTPWRDRRGWRAIDSRHGRVLFYPHRFRFEPFGRVLTVWNPITGEEQRLPEVPRAPVSWSAAVLCAAAAGTCDHHPDCHRGPFSVVFVGIDDGGLFSCVYSSVDGAWSEPASVEHPDAPSPICLECVPAVLVGNALYFLFQSTARILRFDLCSRQLFVIQRPPECADDYQGRPLLMSVEDGRLGFASVHKSKLYLWPGEVGADGEAIWAQSRVIELGTLLRGGLPFLLGFGFTDGVRVIFVWTIGDGVSILNLNPLHVMGSVGTDMDIYGAIPYVSYYIPALRIAAEDGGG